MEEVFRENERLRAEIESLRSELEGREELLIQAGEMGKKVMDMNQELNNKMEDMSREFAEQLTQKLEVSATPLTTRHPVVKRGEEEVGYMYIL